MRRVRGAVLCLALVCVLLLSACSEGESSALAYYNSGIEKLEAGSLDEAGEDFGYCFSVADDTEKLHFCLGIYEAYVSINREGDGAAYLEEALEATPRQAEDHAALGLAYSYLGDYENACLNLKEAAGRGYTDANWVLGSLYIEEGDVSSARFLYNEILSEGGNDALAYNGLALCDMANGDYESALVYIGLGLECSDEDANQSLMYNEVVAYEGLLDFETAGEKAKEYNKQYPSDEKMQDELRFLQHT